MSVFFRLPLLVLLAAVLLGNNPQPARAAQYFAPSYHFTEEGKLDKPLSVAFTPGGGKTRKSYPFSFKCRAANAAYCLSGRRGCVCYFLCQGL